MANIVVASDYSIRTTYYDSDKTYELSDLSFYISEELSDYVPYLMITDKNGISDICKLFEIQDNSKNYRVYNVDYAQELRITDGICKIKLIFIHTDDKICNVSSSTDINLKFENYVLYHQLYMTTQINNNINLLYKKIVDLTELNIELYEKMKEGGKENV